MTNNFPPRWKLQRGLWPFAVALAGLLFIAAIYVAVAHGTPPVHQHHQRIYHPIKRTLYPKSMFVKHHGLYYLKTNNAPNIGYANCNARVSELHAASGPPYLNGHGAEFGKGWFHCWGGSMKWMSSYLVLYEKALAGNMVAEAASNTDSHSFHTFSKRDYTIFNTTHRKCYVGKGNARRWFGVERGEWNDSGGFGNHYKQVGLWAWGCKAY